MYKDTYIARAQPLFYSLNLLFTDVPVAVAVVVFLNTLYIDKLSIFDTYRKERRKYTRSQAYQGLQSFSCVWGTLHKLLYLEK